MFHLHRLLGPLSAWLRERVLVCLRNKECLREEERVCTRDTEREGKRVRVFMRERESVCVCVWETEKECVFMRDRGKMKRVLYDRQREGVGLKMVCVCLRAFTSRPQVKIFSLPSVIIISLHHQDKSSLKNCNLHI